MEEPFRASIPAGTRLIETFGWRPDTGATHWPRHRARLLRSAARLGFAVTEGEPDRVVAGIDGSEALRCRLTLDAGGRVDVTTSPAGPPPRRWRIGLAVERLCSDDPWLGVKTTQRALYDAARAALPAGLDEVIFINERGEVCEGTITNIFVARADGAHVTPPLGSGVLPGVLRARLLEEGWSEAVLRLDDLAQARAIWVGNSLRGLIAADWIAP